MHPSGITALRTERRWDPCFARKSPLFWPLARAAAHFEHDATWPAVETYARAFDAESPVAFAPPARGPRRKRRALTMPYDAAIHLARRVPTRPRNWHDFMNALVWATFPRAKLALHARQHGAIAARGAVISNARTRELDTLALLDEGGVLLVGERAIVFGHAIYEHLLDPSLRVHGRTLTLDAASTISDADARLAAILDDPTALRTPDALGRIDVGERLALEPEHTRLA